MGVLKSKGVQLAGSVLTIIGTLIVLYDMFLAEEKKGVFESLGFFVFAVGLLISLISRALNKKEKKENSKEE